ncbi:glycosyltransferase family 2 protein [Pedobacter xixiisoli]|uniref:Glycosyltransferase, GT2 family n=1 Tax=Pedobacter xixiisoli TaxID=1476464 RepID=A0A285ZYY7_9SPHI|nr:glycosyltransferase family 2 protein [Pedobacter xixiisoli]SOD14870.1 Glycosyltransferase, GT2 family [Pedobacter xixiisoli]
MNNKKSISVILPNYNGKHLMEKFIPSTLEALALSQVEYEFIIIDDCSKDESVAFIEGNYPNFILLKNEINNGFSKTCNKGINHASKDLIFLLNSDVQLTPSYFENQFQYFSDINTFGVMGRIMNFDGKNIEDTARLPYYKGGKFKANKFYYTEGDSNTFTTYLSGANALIDREKILLLNGFDEIYSPFYFEDFDLGLRAWKMGWFCYYDHQSYCYHQVSSSTGKVNKGNSVKVIYNRNSFLLQSIHLEGTKRVLWFVQLLTLTLLGHLLKGEFWILKSLREFIAQKNKVAQSKFATQSLQRKLGSNYNLNHIIATIGKSIVNKNVKWL